MSGIPSIVVHHAQHMRKVRDFLNTHQPEGASITFGRYPTWLFKATARGNKGTICKLVDASRSDEVHDMITKEFHESVERKKARLAEESAKFFAAESAEELSPKTKGKKS